MIFIPHNVPSLKNGKTPVSLPGKKHSTLIPAPAVKKYLQKIGIKSYKTRAKEVEVYKDINRPNLFQQSVGDYFQGIKYPVVVKFFFVRDSKREFDFHNAVQLLADLLVAHDFIPDDSMKYFVPAPMKTGQGWYAVNQKEPGVWLKKVD